MYSVKCPSCKQINIKQEILIEHYSCGEVYPKETGSDTCPKCNKHIGSVGKDYLESTDYYVCKSCNDKFPRPFYELICLECGNVFVESTIKWKKDTLYRIKN
jgi:phage FluMu protein Com